mgnify:FL=1
MERKFTVSQLRTIRDNMTISRDAGLDSENTVTFFSLGANTSISQETYDVTANGKFKMGLLLVLE